MPRTAPQWTGLAVTLIIALGCDRDVIYAIPIGVMAGAIAWALIAFDESRLAMQRAKGPDNAVRSHVPAE